MFHTLPLWENRTPKYFEYFEGTIAVWIGKESDQLLSQLTYDILHKSIDGRLSKEEKSASYKPPKCKRSMKSVRELDQTIQSDLITIDVE